MIGERHHRPLSFDYSCAKCQVYTSHSNFIVALNVHPGTLFSLLREATDAARSGALEPPLKNYTDTALSAVRARRWNNQRAIVKLQLHKSYQFCFLSVEFVARFLFDDFGRGRVVMHDAGYFDPERAEMSGKL